MINIHILLENLVELTLNLNFYQSSDFGCSYNATELVLVQSSIFDKFCDVADNILAFPNLTTSQIVPLVFLNWFYKQRGAFSFFLVLCQVILSLYQLFQLPLFLSYKI